MTLISFIIFTTMTGDPFSSGTWIDLSYSFDRETIYWPTASPFSHETEFEGKTEAGFFYSAYKFSASEHGGTHLDAPVHFAEGKHTVDQIPINKLMGPVAVIDVESLAMVNRDYLVTISDMEKWEAKFGRLPAGAIVFIRTGYGSFWPDREKYLGTAESGPAAVPHLHFPGLDPAAAVWLANERNIHAVGLDTPSIDRGQSTQFEAHQALAAQNIAVIENLAQLDQVPLSGSYSIILPMKIGGGSGGPARVAVWIPN